MMNKRIVVGVLAALSVGAVCAYDYFGLCGWMEKFVADGASEVLGGGYWADDATVVKTGPGVLVLDAHSIASPQTPTLNVYGGTVKIAKGTPEAQETPTAILNRAALWLDATADNFSTALTGEGVSYWYDVREVQTDGVWGSEYWAAEARSTNNTVVASETVPVVYPILDATAAVNRMVYFNGYKSGSWMKIVAPGKRNGTQGSTGLEGIRHVFAVWKFNTSLGYPLSSTSLSYASRMAPFFHPGSVSASAGAPLFSANAARTEVHAGTISLNGQHVLSNVGLPSGLTVLNWQTGCPGSDVKHLADLGALYNDRNLFSYNRQGGDWLGELIVFREALTESERAAVEAYLLAKWRGVEKGRLAINLAKDTVARSEVDGEITLLGAGLVDVAAGACTTVSVSRAGRRFDGRVSVQDTARADVIGAEPEFAFTSGDAVTLVADGHDTRTVTRTAGTAGVIAVAATNRFRVSSIPEGVVKYSVTGAEELILSAPQTASPVVSNSKPFDVAIPNATFETAFNSDQDWSVSGNTSYAGASYTRLNHSSSSWWMSDYSITHAALEGNYCLALKKFATARTGISLPREGRYEFSALVSSRSLHYSRGVVDVFIVKNSATTTVGRLYGDYPSCRVRQKLHSPVLPEGDCQLFLLLNGEETGGLDVHIFLDDLKMRYLPNTTGEMVFSVPNGGFEKLSNWPQGMSSLETAGTAYTDVNKQVLLPEAWTLSGSENAISGVTACQKLCGAFTRGMPGYVNESAMEYGSIQLMMSGANAKAVSAAFTPPAGTWRLRLRAMALKGDSNSTSPAYSGSNKYSTLQPRLRAAVSIEDGAETEIGQINVLSAVSSVTFDQAFTVDGTQTVSVSLGQMTENTASNVARALVDDVELVRVEADGELVANGSFETNSDWKYEANKEIGGNYSGANRSGIGSSSIYYGTEKCDGNYHLRLDQMGRAYQTVTFPEAGTYRLGFWTRARPDNLDGSFGGTHTYSGNRVHAYLTDSAGSVIDILTTEYVYSWFYVEHRALFTVPAAGTYEFSLAGTHDGSSRPPYGGYSSQADCHAFVDLVSIRKVGAPVSSLSIPESLELELGSRVKLRLDYEGELTLKRLRFDGRSYVGNIDATTVPTLVSGPGRIFVRPNGTLLLFR